MNAPIKVGDLIRKRDHTTFGATGTKTAQVVDIDGVMVWIQGTRIGRTWLHVVEVELAEGTAQPHPTSQPHPTAQPHPIAQAAPQPEQSARIAELERELAYAAESLETISKLSGKDDYLMDMSDVRQYANNRAKEARAALPGKDRVKPLPHWEPCNEACDPEFNGQRSRLCGRLCDNAREALTKQKESDHDQD